MFQRSDENEEEVDKKDIEEEVKPDSLTQLMTALSRAATKEQTSSLPEDPLYMAYAGIMSKVSLFQIYIFISSIPGEI